MLTWRLDRFGEIFGLSILKTSGRWHFRWLYDFSGFHKPSHSFPHKEVEFRIEEERLSQALPNNFLFLVDMLLCLLCSKLLLARLPKTCSLGPVICGSRCPFALIGTLESVEMEGINQIGLLE